MSHRWEIKRLEKVFVKDVRLLSKDLDLLNERVIYDHNWEATLGEVSLHNWQLFDNLFGPFQLKQRFHVVKDEVKEKVVENVIYSRMVRYLILFPKLISFLFDIQINFFLLLSLNLFLQFYMVYDCIVNILLLFVIISCKLDLISLLMIISTLFCFLGNGIIFRFVTFFYLFTVLLVITIPKCFKVKFSRFELVIQRIQPFLQLVETFAKI